MSDKPPSAADDPIRVRSVEVLSNDWARLTKTTFDYRRRDGRWRTLVRQVFDRGDGAAVLPYDPDRGVVLLVRQFRYAAYLKDGDGWLIEACAGVLDGDDPQTCVRKEAMEELGVRLGAVERACEAFTSPGAVTETLTLFTARYAPADRVAPGGGDPDEGEDIEVIETPFIQALEMIAAGDIRDVKTILLLQHLSLSGRMTGERS
jgi:nudix-type nucleoside diphosphatase (YffH/AdpP family)